VKKTKRDNSIYSNRENNVSPNNTMLAGVFQNLGMGYGQSPLSMPYELGANSNYTPITLNRVLLSYSYMTFGIIQTFIDQPVEDAFRGGLELKSDELSQDEIKELEIALDKEGDLKAIKDTMKWAKLYGGAGLIINTNQDPTTPLDMGAINEDSPLEFIDADRWELLLNYLQNKEIECPYNYYGEVIHKSRVIKITGKDAPSYIRRRLQGWGMSELERTIRPLNAFVKNEDLIYQLLDEAKIDVWRIQGFNVNILSALGQNQTNGRLQIANMLKNFHRAIIMDKEDEYEQKQISFSGLAEILNQNRIGIAAAVRMPMTKLFGLSAAGFNSGEDDIENYNALVESEVRAKAREILREVLPIRCQKLFGFMPESLDFEFKPLRVLGSVEEENIKAQKFNRYSALYSQGMITPEEYSEILKKEGLQDMETEVGEGIREPEVPESSATIDMPQKPISGTVKEEAKT
jgi:phage-related protein (TIGR01555 family)